MRTRISFQNLIDKYEEYDSATGKSLGFCILSDGILRSSSSDFAKNTVTLLEKNGIAEIGDFDLFPRVDFIGKEEDRYIFEANGKQFTFNEEEFNVAIDINLKDMKFYDEYITRNFSQDYILLNTNKEIKTVEKSQLEFHFGDSEIDDEWISESAIVRDFAKNNPNTSFALANAVVQYLDVKEYYDNLDIHGGNYKTDFNIKAQIGEDTFEYDGRIDIGKSTFTDGETLISHIKSFNEGIIKSNIYPCNLPEQKEKAQNVLDKLVPFLEKNSKLTEEEQRIFDDFKSKNPIKNMSIFEKGNKNQQTKRKSEIELD